MRRTRFWLAVWSCTLAFSMAVELYGCGERGTKRFERVFSKLVEKRADREEFRSRLGPPHSASFGERNCWTYTDHETYVVSACFEPETGRFLAEEALILDRIP